MKTVAKLITILTFLANIGVAMAEGAVQIEAKKVDPGLMAVIANLKRLYPSTAFKEVTTTPLPGVYQVTMNRNVAFTDDTGRYFIFGRMFDMQEQRDMTDGAAQRARQIDFAALPTQDAVVTIKGNGSRKLAVFSDPDCPYCKQLEGVLEKVSDVTVFTFLMPIDALHPNSKRKAIGVWCAADRASAWAGLMLHGQEVAGNCENPVERNMKLAQTLGINGTPTLVFQSGQVVPGAPSLDQLEQFLRAGK